ncbi:MAG: DNA-binding protein WhiA, partial [Oscillospiraceae bacterium]|nr:DNA-binding protein WhiA [Oscillospiraceae bacterium]
DIKYIFEQKSESFLPEELYQVAKLRLENPEMSLRELCESVEPPLSRSGMNHRLKKISEIANNIRSGKI